MTKTKKVVETEKWVDEYIKKNRRPPTYKMIEKQFGITASGAHMRCRFIRDKMNTNNKHQVSKIKLFYTVPTNKLEGFGNLVNQIEKLLYEK